MYYIARFQAITAGNYILSVASSMIARIANPQVIIILAQVVEDLVRGKKIYFSFHFPESHLSASFHISNFTFP